MNPYWFIYHLQFDAITGKLERHYTGSTIKHLTDASLSHYVMKVPSIKEQNEVKRIKNLMELIGELRNASTQITKSLDILNQSTLAKAFRGELVEQAPNDEPASVLLDRIRTGREKVQGSKGTKGRKSRSPANFAIKRCSLSPNTT